MPSLGSWSTIAYTYDPAGRRIEEKVEKDGATYTAVYDGSREPAVPCANLGRMRRSTALVRWNPGGTLLSVRVSLVAPSISVSSLDHWYLNREPVAATVNVAVAPSITV